MTEARAAAKDLAGLLLTGGGSTRMGVDKATLLIDGEPLATHLAELLGRFVEPVVEVGPGVSGRPAVREEPRGSGPLVALVAGATELRRRGHLGAVIVLACDLPRLGAPALSALAAFPSSRSVVPLVDGEPQPLCARWSASDLALAAELVGEGARALRALLARAEPVLLDASMWPSSVSPTDFADVDTPGDLAALGVEVTTVARPHDHERAP